jgi:hypothetical protein
VSWAFEPTTYGYELPVTDVSKANEEYTKNIWLQYDPNEEYTKNIWLQYDPNE